MSYRVEHTDALTLMRELPDGWAQTCIARPPSDREPDRSLAILAETRRVLRDDGTLWLLSSPAEQQLLAAMQAQGWKQQLTPSWAAPLTSRGRKPHVELYLFAKQARYFYDADATGHRAPHRASPCQLACGRSRHIQRCAVAFEHERDLWLIRRCVLAGSSPLACGQCGAPYRRNKPNARTPGIRRPTCQHNSPAGNCLILDPFYTPSLPSAEAALGTGRSFLGIQDTTRTRQTR